VPVVLFPVGFGKEGARSIGIRAFVTNDFMTGSPACPGRDLPLEAVDTIVNRILAGSLQKDFFSLSSFFFLFFLVSTPPPPELIVSAMKNVQKQSLFI
jgi:hypothetical protein